MSSEWSFTVAEAPGNASPWRKPGSVTLTIACRLELFPTEKEPKPQLIANLRRSFVVSLRELQEDGDNFFTRIFTEFPPVVHIENLDIHGVAGRVISLATTTVSLQVSLKVVRVMQSAEIERVTFDGWRCSGLFLEPTVDEKKLCSICFEEFGFMEIAKPAKCTHIYHRRCIFRWLENNKACPVCRCIVRS